MIKPGDIVYHRRTGRGPFKVIHVGGESRDEYPWYLEAGFFIHSDEPTYHSLIEDYEVRNI